MKLDIWQVDFGFRRWRSGYFGRFLGENGLIIQRYLIANSLYSQFIEGAMFNLVPLEKTEQERTKMDKELQNVLKEPGL